MSVCTAGYREEATKALVRREYRGEATKALVREEYREEATKAVVRVACREGVLQRDGYYREMGITEREREGKPRSGAVVRVDSGGDDVQTGKNEFQLFLNH